MTDLKKHIEQTLLKQDASKNDFIKLFEDAKQYHFFGVCVPPCHVRFAKEHLTNTDIKIITVIGFPLGYNTSEVKAFETTKAIEDGADEIDMVLNVSALKSKNWDYVLEDIESVKKACGSVPLKVIIETDLLSKDEIEKACILCIEAKADFVKTSTGFVKNGIGATTENISLIARLVHPYGLHVKASGGVKNKEQALAMLNAGADRIGTSSGVSIIQD